jgi:uncharacterized membrane protein YidH (DUF202 family)
MEADRGLQAERTVLAWWRTAFAAVVAGLLIVREALEQSVHLGLVVLSAATSGLLLAVVVWRVTALQRGAGNRVAPPSRATTVFAGAALALQALAVVLVTL